MCKRVNGGQWRGEEGWGQISEITKLSGNCELFTLNQPLIELKLYFRVTAGEMRKTFCIWKEKLEAEKNVQISLS